MKRHPALAPWSRDHHALVIARRLRHADEHDAAVVRTLLGHMLLRRDVARLSETAPLEWLHGLGERLSAHVKLEEHELFPLIEHTIPEPELSALADRLAAPQT